MINTALRTKADFDWCKAHPYASLDDKLVDAEDAQSGKFYHCPICGTQMYVRTNQHGVSYYVHRNGMPHTEDICRTKESKGGNRIATVNSSDFRPEKFFDKLLGVAQPNHPPIDPHGNDDPPQIVPPPIDKGDIDPENYKKVTAASVKDIVDLGLHRRDPDRLINEKNGVRVKDMIYSVLSFQDLFNDPALLNNVPKIVELKPIFPNEAEHTILCKGFFKNGKNDNGKNEYTDIYFRLVFEGDNDLFDTWVNRLFERYTRDNKTKGLRSRYKSVFVAGNWNLSENRHQYKDVEYLTFETQVVNPRRQIYPLPV